MAKPLLRITLSETAQELLKLMADQQGIGKSPMLEILIREAAKARNVQTKLVNAVGLFDGFGSH